MVEIGQKQFNWWSCQKCWECWQCQPLSQQQQQPQRITVVVAAAAREMTAPTKNWWQQQGGTFTPENMQNAVKQHNKNRALNISWNANLEHMKIN